MSTETNIEITNNHGRVRQPQAPLTFVLDAAIQPKEAAPVPAPQPDQREG